MAESITISSTPPALKSMQYDFLKEEGLKYIEELASKIWTDYNESDPGITLLEALSYAITDLGYRSSYSIPDILAQNPNDPQIDIKNFYTAREILPICPVTFEDYRKLLIDCEVHDPEDQDCPTAGVKNAWIEKAPENEVPIFLDNFNDTLSYAPIDPANPDQLDLKVLYNILLEFDRCENLGDLNENTIEQRISVYNVCPSNPLDPELSGLSIDVQVEFAYWDQDIDWESTDAIKMSMQNIVLDFSQLPIEYTVQGYGLDSNKDIWLIMTKGVNQTPVDTTCIVDQLAELVYGATNTDNFLIQYQKKINKVLEIVAEVRKKLMANRNLCEDFYQINALRVEEIALCADIIVDTDADIEEVLAQVYFEVGNFLSPMVYFHTLAEMYELGYKTEEIFEGPALEHGFIDPQELANANRKQSIHVSDLINIIMDIPGVQAINDLQIANIPLDNTENIPSKSVKWCLQLAFDKNYVPRLSTERSKITFLKEQLPYSANEVEVDALLEQMINNQPPQKLHNTPLDIEVPEGTYRDIDNYFSVQEEFPLVYGIGSEGISSNAPAERQAQAKQLKGFLLFFDQLLADYLAQLNNVKNLFSMNGERDANGNFVIDKTYYTQSLVPYVPNISPLLVNEATYPANLQALAEDPELFDERRNRFLDHLMARFSEQFTDYALLVYRLSGPKAPDELLEDKLKFLDEYPRISGGRFKAFNYESPCKIWHVDNVAGLERRISLLTGIDTPGAKDLEFPDEFSIIAASSPNDDKFIYTVSFGAIGTFTSTALYDTEDDAKKGIEELIINAADAEKNVIIDSTGTIVPTSSDGVPPYTVATRCNGSNIATSQELSDSASVDAFLNALSQLIDQQYYDNIESNRHNLACPLLNYFNCLAPVAVNMVPDPPVYYVMFDLFEQPFNFLDTNKKLLTGVDVSADNIQTQVEIIGVDPGTFSITVQHNITSQLETGDSIEIVGSDDNDGTYTVDSVTPELAAYNTVISRIVLAGSPTLTTDVPLGQMEFTIKRAFKGNGDCKLSEKIIAVDLVENEITLQGDFSPWIALNDPVTISGSADNNGDYTVADVVVNVISPTETETVIELFEALTSDTLPLGQLEYNQLTAEEFAESIDKEKILFEIAQRGLDASNYGFTNYQLEPYRFFITDDCDNPIAEAIETNYNQALTEAIISQNAPTPTSVINIINSTANDGTYNVLPATDTEAQGAQIRVTIDTLLPSPIADGQVQFTESDFDIQNVLNTKHQITLAFDLSRKIFTGDQFEIYDASENNGTYTVTDINFNPDSGLTTITVDEDLEAVTTDNGKLEYTKELNILFVVPAANSEVYVKGGADDFAVQQMSLFLRDKFFSHEGLHILEHILLRPKYNEDIFVNFTSGAKVLDDGVVIPGDMSFMKKLLVDSVDLVENTISVLGDITAELAGLALQTVYIEGSEDAINDGAYVLLSFSFTGTHTVIKLFESIPSDSLSPLGDFIYPNTVPISTVPTTTSVVIPVAEAEISTNFPFTISNSQDGINDGRYESDLLNVITGSTTEVVFFSRETLISDELLPVNLLEDCLECKVDDPYSFIMTVVMPAWQGRFANQDFRAFFERSFRLECPAHLVPNICWVDCEQMTEFEEAYKRWLIENEKINKDPLLLSTALNQLIDILTRLRSIYPVGTLHDCNVDDTLDNAIILDRTELGTI